MEEELSWLPFLLQTSDALFPTGAYAHSLGFEECVRLGVVSSEATLRAFLMDQIVPAQRELELPYLRFAYESTRDGDLGELCSIDMEISAWKLAREIREASIQLGVRRLKALREIARVPLLDDFEKLIAQGRAHGHHLTISGLQFAIQEVPLRAALMTAFYQSLSTVCGAAMKLIRIGQSGCQRVLREASATAAEVVSKSLTIERAEAGWFNPVLEIASMRHERAQERLFIS
jgi:urease accessory protein